MKKTTKFSITLVGTTLLGNNPLADMTSPADNPSAPTPQHVANDSFLSKLGIPADLKIARGATWRDTREGDTKPLSAASNDNLANATIITALPYTSTIDTSLTSPSLEINEILPSCQGSGVPGGYTSVWYQYTPTHDHSVVIQTTDSSYSPSLSVWTGTTHPLTEQACGSSVAWNGSSDLTTGTTYYINVGIPANLKGNLVLNVNEPMQSPNDNLANATLITSLPYQSQQLAQWATSEDTEKTEKYASCGWGITNSVWYQYTPTIDQTVVWEMTTLNDLYNRETTLSLWKGTSQALTELGCDYGVGNTSSLPSKLTAGTTYYLRVAYDNYSYYSGHLNFSLSVSPFTPPTNDNLANATVISALPYSNTSQEVFGSTPEDLEVPSRPEVLKENSVWYQYTPTKNQSVVFSDQSSYYQLLSVWTGATHPLTELAYSDYPQDEKTTVQTRLLAGTTYYIKISGALPNKKSTVSFAATEVILPSNDDLTNATVISALPYSHSQGIQWATVEPDEVNEFNYEHNAGGCGEGYFIYGFGSSVRYQYTGSSVWYQYTPDHDQLVEFDTLGSSYDTVLSVWTGTTHPLTPLTCSDNEYGVVLSQASLKLTAHTTYYIKVGSRMSLYDGDNGGILNFYAQEILPPRNDNLDQAIPISSLPYTHLQNTQGASLEAKEVTASCAKPNIGMSVWYTYTPVTSQTVILDTQASSYDTVLSIWTGNSQPLTEIACHDDLSATDLQSKLSVTLTAGTTYSINVSSVNSYPSPVSAGTLNLTVTANDLQLSPLGKANMIDALGNPVTSSTEVWGGISVNGNAYQAQVVENLSDEAEVWGKMKVDPKHVGQTADTVVYAIYKSSALVPDEYFYMVDNRYSIYPWDQNPANLMAPQTVRLAPEQWQALYRGRFPVPGVLDIFWGYRLADGTIVTNSQGLRVTINRQVN